MIVRIGNEPQLSDHWGDYQFLIMTSGNLQVFNEKRQKQLNFFHRMECFRLFMRSSHHSSLRLLFSFDCSSIWNLQVILTNSWFFGRVLQRCIRLVSLRSRKWCTYAIIIVFKRLQDRLPDVLGPTPTSGKSCDEMKQIFAEKKTIWFMLFVMIRESMFDMMSSCEWCYKHR